MNEKLELLKQYYADRDDGNVNEMIVQILDQIILKINELEAK